MPLQVTFAHILSGEFPTSTLSFGSLGKSSVGEGQGTESVHKVHNLEIELHTAGRRAPRPRGSSLQMHILCAGRGGGELGGWGVRGGDGEEEDFIGLQINVLGWNVRRGEGFGCVCSSLAFGLQSQLHDASVTGLVWRAGWR